MSFETPDVPKNEAEKESMSRKEAIAEAISVLNDVQWGGEDRDLRRAYSKLEIDNLKHGAATPETIGLLKGEKRRLIRVLHPDYDRGENPINAESKESFAMGINEMILRIDKILEILDAESPRKIGGE